MTSKPTFVNRTSDPRDPINQNDFIALANAAIASGANITVDSPLYQSALDQYNSNLNKAKVQRLEVPKGFCGYVDPATGELRVEPDIDDSFRRLGISTPTTTSTGVPANTNPIPYPIDQCLQVGLPGSLEYSDAVNCSDEIIDDGDSTSSGINWYTVGAGSSASGGGGGFVWKPASDSDGKLVVLLPSGYRGSIATCGIYNDDAGTSLVEMGRFVGDTNSNRPTFRFSQSGGGYGSNIYVVINMTSGGTFSWYIANGASRTEY